jgi:GNAT superfamily N-acetyltransferase
MDEHGLVIEVRQNDTLSSAELQGLDEVDRLAFSGNEGEEFAWASGNLYVIGWVDGTIVASLQIIDRMAKIGDLPVRLGGIGGVATHPDHRRRGYASALMNRAGDFLRNDLKVDFGLLICAQSKIHLYNSVGWQEIKGPLLVDQPTGKIVFDTVTMILPCSLSTWPDGVVDICGLPW